MKITKVCCQGCGAPLEVSEEIHYVTCNQCGSRLEVVHDPTITHTRILEDLQRATRTLSSQVHQLQLQKDLDRLDQEWERFRLAVSSKDQHGQVHEPSCSAAVSGSVVVGILAGALFLLGLKLSGSAEARWLSTIAIIGAILMGVFSARIASSGSRKARNFMNLRLAYQVKRANLRARIAREG